MPERDIFLAVIDLPAAERTEFLDKACGTDAALRNRVERLLRSHDEAGNFLGAPAVPADVLNNASTVAFTPPPSTGIDSEEDENDSVPLSFLAPSSRPDSLGRIGHYEVLQVLGKGGFGIVFRAFDEVLHRVVAVKVLSPEMAATSPARKRFLREARSSAQVRHENVVQVYAVEDQPLPYLVMEFIPGETLKQRLDRNGPLEVLEVVRIGRQIAEGLSAAHANDLIHRDIKPGNILLEGGAQRVKITDFGLARAADDASISKSGIVAGTPMYMAPEQANGDTLDQRADLFSLGSVLYQMTTGRPPFRGNGTLAVLRRVAADTPRPIRDIVPETPEWLCDIITKLHAKNPDERFQSARQVADIFADCEEQLKAGGKVQISHLADKRKPSAVSKRHSRRWVVAAALLFPLLGLAGTELAGMTHLFGRRESSTPPVASVATPAVPEPPAINPDRKAAEWVLSVGGNVGVNGLMTSISTPADLPGEPFRLTVVNLTANKSVTDEGLAILKDCTKLTQLWLSSTAVTDKGLAHFRDCKSLTHLHLGGTKVTPERVAELAAALPECRIESDANESTPDRRAIRYVLSAGGTVYLTVGKKVNVILTASDKLPVEPFTVTAVNFVGKQGENTGDAVFDACKGLTQLTAISLDKTHITNPGLAQFLASPVAKNLTILNVRDTGIGDAGLVSLGTLKGLQQFNAAGCSQVTNRTLALLKGCPIQQISLDRTAVTNNGLANLQGMKLKHLSLTDCTGFDNAGLAPFKSMTTCNFIDLSRTRIGDEGLKNVMKNANLGVLRISGTRVTRAGLEPILNLQNLEQLFLGELPVGDEFLSKLKDFKNMKMLDFSGTDITDAGLAHLKALPSLTSVSVRNTKVSTEAAVKFSRERPDCSVVNSAIGDLRAWTEDKAAVKVFHASGATLVLIHPTGETRRLVTPEMPLPEGPYRLASVDMLRSSVPNDFVSKVLVPTVSPLTKLNSIMHLPRNASFTSDDLNNLAGSSVGGTLGSFIAESCQLTPESLAALKRFPKLNQLAISGRAASDELAAQLIGLPGLTDLSLMHLKQVGPKTRTQIDRVALRSLGFDFCNSLDRELCVQLGRQPKLKNLQLADTNIQDEWLSDIAKSASIRGLSLTRTAITDAGLEHLARMKSLRAMTITGCKATLPGVKKLAAELPMCRIEFGGTTIEPTVNFAAERKAAEYGQSTGGGVIAIEGPAHFKGCTSLQQLNLSSTLLTVRRPVPVATS